jgi:sugar lactone lactonase YvrE
MDAPDSGQRSLSVLGRRLKQGVNLALYTSLTRLTLHDKIEFIQSVSLSRRRPALSASFQLEKQKMMALYASNAAYRRTARTTLLSCCLSLFLWTGCAPVQKQLGTRFYPPPPQAPKIQFLARIASSKDVVPSKRLKTFVKGEEPPSRFIKPYGVETRGGLIYVCDARRAAVAEIDPVNHKFEWLPNEGPGKLRKPVNLAVDKDGTKYVADLLLGQVLVYDNANRFQKALGTEGQFKPVDVAVFKERLYVLDIQDQQVKILDKNTGAVAGSIGGPAVKEGRLAKPSDIYVDKDGNVYVTNTLNCRIEKYDDQGNHLLSVGECGDAIGSFIRPKGVAVDDNGFIYVVDTALENVQIFSPRGENTLSFGGPGDASVPGALWLPSSIDIAYDKSLIASLNEVRDPDFDVEYLILVMSQFGPPYMNIYGFGEPRAASALARGDAGAHAPARGEVESASVPGESVPEEPVTTAAAEAAPAEPTQPSKPSETEQEGQAILALVEHWRNCWETLEFNCYIEHYGSGFKHGKMDLVGWRAYKRSIFRQKKHVEVQLEDIRISRSGSNRLARFMQTFRSGRLSDYGEKVLTLGREGGTWKIIGEEWTAAERVARPTVPAAGDAARSEILSFIEGWKNCWGSLDLPCYIEYYGQSFRHREMDLADWKDYRRGIFSRQKNVRLTFEAIEISGFGSDRRVRFMQNFQSDRYNDFGEKTLTLRQEGETWKIIGEEWKAR